MPIGTWLGLAAATAGAVLVAGGAIALRVIGARLGTGRRLAGAEHLAVGALVSGRTLPPRSVRISGRVRCPEPITTADGDRLVAYHRDIEVELPRVGWRTVERLRETRPFELWDHDGSVTVDPAAAAEPMVVIPHVWHGLPDELADEQRPALERLESHHGAATAARATTRMISVVDRLLVLAEVEGPAHPDPRSAVRLRAPRGGYVISNLELDEAMRLLGGPRRGLLTAAIVGLASGMTLLVVGLAVAVLAWVIT